MSVLKVIQIVFIVYYECNFRPTESVLNKLHLVNCYTDKCVDVAAAPKNPRKYGKIRLICYSSICTDISLLNDGTPGSYCINDDSRVVKTREPKTMPGKSIS